MDPSKDILDGLTDRVRNLLLALDRQDRLETAEAFVGWLAREREEGRLAEAAREVLLRALRAAGDPVNFRLLTMLDPLEPATLPDLMRETGLSRVAASERVNDLVQAGLAARELIGDQIRGTPLAVGLVAMVEQLAAAAGDQLEAATRPADEALARPTPAAER